MEPLPKSKAQMVWPAFEVSAFIFFFPSFCGAGSIMAENQPPAKSHFRQRAATDTELELILIGLLETGNVK